MASSINVKIAPLPRGDYSSSATYAKLDVVSYNGSSYMAIKAVPTGTVPTNTTYWQLLAEKPTIGDGTITTNMLADGAVTADKLDSSVSEKYAEVSGTYEDMVVGSAEQLLSTQYDTDSVPYAFRKSPYGDRELDEIVGGTIAWNQLLKNGNFADGTTEWSGVSATLSVTDGVCRATIGGKWNNDIRQISAHVTENHDYFVSVDYRMSDTGFNIQFRNPGSSGASLTFQNATTFTKGEKILKVTNASPRGGFGLTLDGSGDSLIGKYYEARNFQCFDLTQMFGTAIANYIYSLEQSSTGSGVALAKALGNITKPYYAYNAGQLISVTGLTAHKTTGFNQWDEEWELGIYNDGVPASSTQQIRSKYTSPIKVLPKTTYCFTAKSERISRVNWYDANDEFISMYTNLTDSVFTSTSPSNAYYARIQMPVAYGTTYKHDICINISGERNGEYEPYESHSYALDSSLTLRGVPKLVDNKVQFDGDVYSSDGTVQRRYAIVDMSTLTWDYNGTRFRAFMETAPTGAIVTNASVGRNKGIQAKYPMYNGSVADAPDKSFIFGSGVDKFAYIKDSAYTDVQALITSLSGVYLVYKLQTPTTESAEPYVNPQICNEYGTEEYVSAEQSGVTMIVGHNTKYPQNLRKKIEGLPWNFSNLIAPTEVTNKASRNYTVGSFLILNNTLYKVTSAIANGGTITVGSNVTATTIMQEILAL